VSRLLVHWQAHLPRRARKQAVVRLYGALLVRLGSTISKRAGRSRPRFRAAGSGDEAHARAEHCGLAFRSPKGASIYTIVGRDFDLQKAEKLIVINTLLADLDVIAPQARHSNRPSLIFEPGQLDGGSAPRVTRHRTPSGLTTSRQSGSVNSPWASISTRSASSRIDRFLASMRRCSPPSEIVAACRWLAPCWPAITLTPGTAYEQWRGDAPQRSLVLEKQSCCLWGVGERGAGLPVDTYDVELEFRSPGLRRSYGPRSQVDPAPSIGSNLGRLRGS
jgi:hypothetical protein